MNEIVNLFVESLLSLRIYFGLLFRSKLRPPPSRRGDLRQDFEGGSYRGSLRNFYTNQSAEVLANKFYQMKSVTTLYNYLTVWSRPISISRIEATGCVQ